MIILPAIDIKDGQCVRLYQGDYAQVTTYDTDPVQVAQRWQSAGASWLHIVDLDGAAAGQLVNVNVIKSIRAAVSLHMELGGGLRSLADIEHMLNLGIDRVVLGTVALTNRALLEEALTRWQERIAVGLDARNGEVAITGWRETSQVQATSLAAELCANGVQRFIYTDIARDGALKGPNLDALREMQRALTRDHNQGDRKGSPPWGLHTAPHRYEGDHNQGDRKGSPLPYTKHELPSVDRRGDPLRPPCSSKLIASGGVSSLDDLRSLAALDIEGAIVGKALYTGDVDLTIAIQEIET